MSLAEFALLFVGTQWSWMRNNRCKHLVIFMDTRDDRRCRVYDREHRAITKAELRHQVEFPLPPGETPWDERDVSPKELKSSLALALCVVEINEKALARVERDARQMGLRVVALEKGLRDLLGEMRDENSDWNGPWEDLEKIDDLLAEKETDGVLFTKAQVQRLRDLAHFTTNTTDRDEILGILNGKAPANAPAPKGGV